MSDSTSTTATISSPVDRLNKYPPGTIGYVCVGDRWNRWWVRGVICGRVMGMRRVVDEYGEYLFIEHEEQFHLKPLWTGRRANLCAVCKI